MFRKIVHTCAALSLLLCIASVTLWIRSYHITSPTLKIADSINIRKTDPRYWILTHPGQLTLWRQVGKNWVHPLNSFKFLGTQFGGLYGQNSMLWDLILPFWLLTTLFALLPLLYLLLLYRLIQKNLRTESGLCPTCGYDLRASPNPCPECGQPA